MSIGLGFGAALRFVVLRAAFLAGLRAVAFLPFFLALPFAARFRATLSPPLRSLGDLSQLGQFQQTVVRVLQCRELLG